MLLRQKHCQWNHEGRGLILLMHAPSFGLSEGSGETREAALRPRGMLRPEYEGMLDQQYKLHGRRTLCDATCDTGSSVQARRLFRGGRMLRPGNEG